MERVIKIRKLIRPKTKLLRLLRRLRKMEIRILITNPAEKTTIKKPMATTFVK